MNNHEIHLWMGRPKNFAFAQVQIHLATNEIERALRFRFAEDRDAFALAHAIRRIELARFIGAQPQELEFGRSQHGRPTLRNAQPKELAFSASRRRGLVIFAVAHLPRLGVDVEQIGPVEHPESLLSKFLDLECLSAVSTGSIRQRAQAFAKLWTITEACAKARGTGLETFEPRLNVRFESANLAVVQDGDVQWRCELHRPDLKHQVALAYENSGARQVVIKDWPGA